jgi:D-sedoheptulose 7-phosphate isomerase
MSKYINQYLLEVEEIAKKIDKIEINKVVERLVKLKKEKGRLFFLGVGGSAGNCSHAVNDFRKIAQIESYTPVDNVSELTARTNDEGWETIFSNWLEISNLNSKDVVFIFSVGGGNTEKNVSVNIVKAIDYCLKTKSDVVGIVSRDGGHTAQNAIACVKIPVISNNTITPHAEAWQAVIWHLIVTDPRIISYSNKWESIEKKSKKN